MNEIENKKDLIALGNEITTIPLVIERDGVSIANTDLLDAFIKSAKVKAEEKIKNELDLKKLEEFYAQIKNILKNFSTYRKGQLQPLKNIPSAFTSRENKELLPIITMVGDEIERRKETLYLSADKNIQTVLNGLLDTETGKVKAQLDVRVFHKDFSTMRKTSYAQLTEKGKIKKALTNKVTALFEKEVKPIREAFQLEEIKEAETKRFDASLNVYKINSNNVAVLRDILLDIAKQSETVGELYPNIHEYCATRLKNTYSQVQNNIKALESEAKRIEAEAKVKALRDADLPILSEAKSIDDAIESNDNNKEWLNMQLQAIQGLVQKLSFRENIETLKQIEHRLMAKIELLILKAKEDEIVIDVSTPFDVVQEPIEVVTPVEEYVVEFEVIATIENLKALKAFMSENGIKYKSI